MKKYILLASLFLFMAVLAAETGLFDLSYGQSLAEAHKALLAKGFQETKRNSLYVSYKNDQIPGLIVLEISDTFGEESISSWTVKYDMNVAGILEKMLSDLATIHKAEPYYDNIFGMWTWEMDSPYGLSAALSKDQSRLTIEYTNSDEIWEYFNW